MSVEKKHINYTAEDIQKYLSGKLLPAEMHAMERAALDDAFLAEAIEGYAAIQDDEWQKQLALLKNSFAAPQMEKVVALPPKPRFMFWKAAAAILVICSGVTITYFLTSKELPQKKTIAAINTKPDTVAKKSEASLKGDTNTGIIAPKEVPHTESIAPPSAASDEPQPVMDSAFIYRPGSVGRKQSNTIPGGGYKEEKQSGRGDYATTNSAPSIVQNEVENDTRAEKSQVQALAEVESLKKQRAEVNQKFVAQVFAPDGSPLPFANVNIPTENIGTYADAKGNFRLISTDTILNVNIKAAGFLAQNVTLKSNLPQNKIILSEDLESFKNKTFVSGKTTPYSPKRRASLVPDSVINVEPVDGWNNYDTYLTNNLKLSETILQKKVHGEVEISFEVESDGALTNMKVDKSLCDDCDKAALKAIKEGPGWRIKKGKKATGKIKVKF